MRQYKLSYKPNSRVGAIYTFNDKKNSINGWDGYMVLDNRQVLHNVCGVCLVDGGKNGFEIDPSKTVKIATDMSKVSYQYTASPTLMKKIKAALK